MQQRSALRTAAVSIAAGVGLTVFGTVFLPHVQAQSQTPSIVAQSTSDPATQFYTQDNGVAIDGTDPVSYFRQAQPIAGSAELSYDWNGATWLFSSEENRDLFVADPERYAPQYGGFCAWAVSQGYTAPTDPDAWTIVDGKLYLNFNQRVQRTWEQDIPGHIQNANANWPAVLDQSEG